MSRWDGGCDDLGGTLMEETISRMAGSQHGSAMTVDELAEVVRGIGRTPRERTTTYANVTRKQAGSTIRLDGSATTRV